jgi:transcriptional regulator with XRE-family HTH domain
VVTASTTSGRSRKIGHLSDEGRELVVDRIKELLDARGMTAREVALKAGVPANTLYDILSKKSDPALGPMVRIAHALRLRSIEELIAPLGTTQLQLLELGAEPGNASGVLRGSSDAA